MNDKSDSFATRLGRPKRPYTYHAPKHLEPADARREFGLLLGRMLKNLDIVPDELAFKNHDAQILPDTLFTTNGWSFIGGMNPILKGQYPLLTHGVATGLHDLTRLVCEERGIDQRRAGPSNWHRLEQLATMIDGPALPADQFFKSSAPRGR